MLPALAVLLSSSCLFSSLHVLRRLLQTVCVLVWVRRKACYVVKARRVKLKHSRLQWTEINPRIHVTVTTSEAVWAEGLSRTRAMQRDLWYWLQRQHHCHHLEIWQLEILQPPPNLLSQELRAQFISLCLTSPHKLIFQNNLLRRRSRL